MPDTTEQARILRAARDGRLRCNEHGRYIIDGEKRPDRRERERLMAGGFIHWPHYSAKLMEITAKGDGILRILEIPQRVAKAMEAK